MKNNQYLIDMGKRIRQERKSKKMSLETLSELTQIDLSNLSFLERGMRNTHILSLKAIADVLEVDVKSFL